MCLALAWKTCDPADECCCRVPDADVHDGSNANDNHSDINDLHSDYDDWADGVEGGSFPRVKRLCSGHAPFGGLLTADVTCGPFRMAFAVVACLAVRSALYLRKQWERHKGPRVARPQLPNFRWALKVS